MASTSTTKARVRWLSSPTCLPRLQPGAALAGGVLELCLSSIVDRLYTCVYSRYCYAASDSQMLTLRSHLVSAESATSEELQQVPIAVLESTEAEASEKVGGRALCVSTERGLTINPIKEGQWLERK